MSKAMTISTSPIEQKLNRKISSLFRHSPFADQKIKREQLTFSEFLSDRMLIISAIREGIPYSLFDLICHYTPFSENDWADLLDISTKSLHRYKADNRHFRPLQSEKIIEMSEVTFTGLDVFGNMEQFKRWLDTPNYALGGLQPMELLKDSYGKELVISELKRINYGILA